MRRLIDNGNRPITPKPHIGHYGRLRKAYLEQYRHRLYTALVPARSYIPTLRKQTGRRGICWTTSCPALPEKQEPPKPSSRRPPMKWVGLMNNCKARAEEIVMHELIYVLTVKSRKKQKSCDNSRPDEPFPVRAVFIEQKTPFPQVKSRGKHKKMPLLRNRGAERRVYENRAYQAGKDHRYMV